MVEGALNPNLLSSTREKYNQEASGGDQADQTEPDACTAFVRRRGYGYGRGTAGGPGWNQGGSCGRRRQQGGCRGKSGSRRAGSVGSGSRRCYLQKQFLIEP